MKRVAGTNLVLISGIEALILGISWRSVRRYAINQDTGYVDRRCLERARRRLRDRAR